MATSEPVVVSSPKLPPKEQLFFRLKETIEAVRDALKQLTSAFAEVQDCEKPEHFQSEIKSQIIQIMKESSGIIMKFVSALPMTMSNPAPEIIEIAQYASGRTAAPWDEAGKEMKDFSDEVITTLEKLRVVLDKDKCRGSAATMFTKTNSQAVNELLGVVNDLLGVVKEVCMIP